MNPYRQAECDSVKLSFLDSVKCSLGIHCIGNGHVHNIYDVKYYNSKGLKQTDSCYVDWAVCSRCGKELKYASSNFWKRLGCLHNMVEIELEEDHPIWHNTRYHYYYICRKCGKIKAYNKYDDWAGPW